MDTPEIGDVLEQAAQESATEETIETPPADPPTEGPDEGEVPRETPPSSEPSEEPTGEETPPGETPAEDPPVEEDYTEEQFFTDLSEDTGLELTSYEQLVENHHELSRLRTENQQLRENPFQGYDPIVADIAKASQSGVDINTYLMAKNLSPSEMDGKEAMFQQFMLQNPNYAKYPQQARQQFERDFKQKYGIIDSQFTDEDDEEGLANHNHLVNDAKGALDWQQQMARDYLTNWQKENTTIPEASPEEGGYSREDYLQDVDQVVSQIDGYNFPIGNEENFKLGFDDNDRASIKHNVDNAADFLRDTIGINLDNGQVDPEKLGAIASMVQAWHKLGSSGLKDWILSEHNRQTLEAQEVNPTDPEKISGEKPGGDDGISKYLDSVATSRR